jgi:hypothetical protein
MKALQRFVPLLATASLLFSQLSWATEPTDQELGKQYLYCGVLYLQIEGETSKAGMTMLALSTMLLGKNSMEAITPELTAAKQQVASDMNDPVKAFNNLTECQATHNSKSEALLTRFEEKEAH